MSRVEQAAYEVLRSEGPIEIRRYQPMVVAEVDVEGDRKPAISRGFRAIAGYIFGGNADARKVAMTAPVMQQRKPLGATPTWFVRFVMPRAWTLETLPRPNDPNVVLKPIASESYAAITFSGFHGRRDSRAAHRCADGLPRARGPHAARPAGHGLLRSALDAAVPAPQRDHDQGGWLIA